MFPSSRKLSSRNPSAHRSRRSKLPITRRPLHQRRVRASCHSPPALPRPKFGEVNSSYIEAAYPELAGVPAEYIRERLPSKGTQLLAALAAVNTQPPTGTLPKELEVVMHDMITADLPTHMLAVHSPSSSRQRKVTIFPVHHLVLAANCSNLPPLPPPSGVPSSSCTAMLPVVPLCLPSAETYPLLQSYLYTKHVDSLLSALLPPATSNIQILARHVLIINGLWRNACALGVIDQNLWNAIDLAWGVVSDRTLQATASQ